MMILFLAIGIKFLLFMLKCLGRDRKFNSLSFDEISIACPKTGFNLIFESLCFINLAAFKELHNITMSDFISLLFWQSAIH